MQNTFDSSNKIDPNKVDEHVGNMLRKRRVFLNVSQQQLSNYSGVSIQQIQKYEKAVNRISCGRLYDFANFLNVEIDYFFKDIVDDFSSLHEQANDFDFEDNIQYASDKEMLQFNKYFNRVKDQSTRRKLIELAKAISETE